MIDRVVCPHCHFEFEVSSAIREHLKDELQKQVKEDLDRRVAEAQRAAAERIAAKDRELEEAQRRVSAAASKEEELLRRQRMLEERERQVGLDLERRLAEETTRIREEEARVARERAARATQEAVRAREEELRREVEARDEALGEARRRATEAAAREAELVKKQREMEDRAAQQGLQVERRVLEESQRIRVRVAAEAEQMALEEREAQRLKDVEHQEKMAVLQRKLDELQQRLAQGSQQAQGEAQELELRELLARAFPFDLLEDVPKGVQGADVLQRVRGEDGREHGTIVWESKRTKAWQDGWLPKLRDDQRAVNAACAVIVSQALPPGVRHFDVCDGVWVCGWSHATALATVLRVSLAEVSLARRASQGSGHKMELLYDYMTGSELRNRVGGFVEALRELQADLDSERRAMQRIWAKREKQIHRAIRNLGGFYGDLQGIAGRSIEDLPALSLEAVAALSPGREPDESETADTPVASPDPGSADEALVELLSSLVPEDGSAVGKESLAAAFTDRTLLELGRTVGPSDYERCLVTLLGSGRLRTGKRGSIRRG